MRPYKGYSCRSRCSAKVLGKLTRLATLARSMRHVIMEVHPETLKRGAAHSSVNRKTTVALFLIPRPKADAGGAGNNTVTCLVKLDIRQAV